MYALTFPHAPITFEIPDLKKIRIAFTDGERKALRYMAYAFIAETVLISAMLVPTIFKIFVPQRSVVPLVYADTLMHSGPRPEYGSATASLMQDLGEVGLAPIARRNITRERFNAPGTLLALEGGTIQVYEYKTEAALVSDLSVLKERYMNLAKKYHWASQVNIYAKGNLLVFYLGNNEEILTALEQFAGGNSAQTI